MIYVRSCKVMDSSQVSFIGIGTIVHCPYHLPKLKLSVCIHCAHCNHVNDHANVRELSAFAISVNRALSTSLIN